MNLLRKIKLASLHSRELVVFLIKEKRFYYLG